MVAWERIQIFSISDKAHQTLTTKSLYSQNSKQPLISHSYLLYISFRIFSFFSPDIYQNYGTTPKMKLQFAIATHPRNS
nr:hypothetical protein CFP56_05616 [Quercus suber]